MFEISRSISTKALIPAIVLGVFVTALGDPLGAFGWVLASVSLFVLLLNLSYGVESESRPTSKRNGVMIAAIAHLIVLPFGLCATLAAIALCINPLADLQVALGPWTEIIVPAFFVVGVFLLHVFCVRQRDTYGADSFYGGRKRRSASFSDEANALLDEVEESLSGHVAEEVDEATYMKLKEVTA